MRASTRLACWASCLAPALAYAQTTASPTDSIYRVEIGAGPATVLVLHGGPGFAHGYLRPEWEALAQKYRVVFYDQRGCGRSVRGGRLGWPQHVDDLHGLVTQYRTHGTVVLAGSSWGSWLALLYVWKYPEGVTALVLSGTPPWPIRSQKRLRTLGDPVHPQQRHEGWPEHLRDEWQALQGAQRKYQQALDSWWQAREDSIEAGLLELPGWDSVMSARRALNLHRRVAARLGEGCLTVSGAIYSSFRDGPTVQQLASVRVPKLLLRGTRANVVGDGADSLVHRLPNAMLITLYGAGHDPWFDWPEAFFAHVERFLRTTLDA